MLPGTLAGDRGIVDPLVVQVLVGDRVVLDAGVRAVSVGMDVRADVLERQVEPDVAVEVAVVPVAGVAVACAPHLTGGLGITPERCHAGPAIEWRVGAVARGAVGQQDAVGVDEEVADRRLAQQLVDAGNVAAFREPHPPRTAAEVALVQVGGDVHLGAQRCPVAIEKRKERVGGRRGDDLESTRLLEAAKGPHQVPLVATPGVANRLEALPVHLRQPVVLGFGARAVELALGELDQTVEVTGVSLLQEVVGEHRDERCRERDGAAIRDAVGDETLEHLHQRQVGPGDALVEPLLFHHRRILGMPHERQVSMQHEREVSRWASDHRRLGTRR